MPCPAEPAPRSRSIGDRVTDASYQPHKGDYFLFRKDVGGGEWYQIFRFDVATGEATMLTDGKSRNSEFVWSNKGDRIAYAGTLRNNADLDFYVIDPAAKPEARKPLTENQGGGWQVDDWSPDDRTLLATEGISINESYLWLVDVATGTKKALTPKGGDKVAYQAIGFSRDGKGVYVTTDKGGEFQRIAYMDIATGELKYLNSDSWDVENASLSEDRELLAYVVNENGLSTLHVFDLKAGKPRSVPKLPTGQIGNLRWHENNRDLAFSLNSAQSPSDVYSVDVQSAKLERWTYSETGGIPPQNFVEPQAGQVEELRRQTNLRLALRAQGETSVRQVSRGDQHSRRPRRPVAARIPGTHQLPHQRAGCRGALSQRARLNRLRKDVLPTR